MKSDLVEASWFVVDNEGVISYQADTEEEACYEVQHLDHTWKDRSPHEVIQLVLKSKRDALQQIIDMSLLSLASGEAGHVERTLYYVATDEARKEYEEMME